MADLADEIAALAEVPTHDLRRAWRRHHGAAPPARLSRDLLLRGLAYELQERAHGGLSRTARRTLGALARRLATEGPAALDAGPALRPGARLVRAWRGRAHTVTVLEDGFEYEGRRYPSLTRIAGLITGAHWSGPRFFGLIQRRRRGTGPSRPAQDPAAEGAARGRG